MLRDKQFCFIFSTTTLKVKSVIEMSVNSVQIVCFLSVNFLLNAVRCLDPYHQVLENEYYTGARSGRSKERLTPPKEMDSDYWVEQAQSSLRQRLNQTPINRMAKNIIFFLGDGMSISTLTAARILKGQRQGLSGEETKLVVEEWPYTGLSKVKELIFTSVVIQQF